MSLMPSRQRRTHHPPDFFPSRLDFSPKNVCVRSTDGSIHRTLAAQGSIRIAYAGKHGREQGVQIMRLGLGAHTLQTQAYCVQVHIQANGGTGGTSIPVREMRWPEAELVKNKRRVEEATPVGVAEERIACRGQAEKVLDGGFGTGEGAGECCLEWKGEDDGVGGMAAVQQVHLVDDGVGGVVGGLELICQGMSGA